MTPRKEIARYGAKRRSVRVFAEVGGTLARVQWRLNGKLQTRSYPNTPAGRNDAKSFARGLAERGLTVAVAERLTLRKMWLAYADDVFPHLRERSRRLYAENWRQWELMWGPGFIAEDTTRKMVTDFRKERDKRHAVTTVGEEVRQVRRVYRWAEDTELIGRNRVEGYRYKVAKEMRPTSPDEYRAEEFARLLASFRPELASQWRPYVALALCGLQGVRQHAVLHLRWEDVDLEARRVKWRSRWDKLGNDWEQKLRDGSVAALEIAAARRDGPWVFYTGSSKSKQPVYTKQSLWSALRRAETRGEVERKSRRGAHGLRRLLAGEVNAITGDLMLAMHAIGDKDIRMANRYLKKRDDRIEDAFDRLDANAEVAK